jgi:hypothetical protein
VFIEQINERKEIPLFNPLAILAETAIRKATLTRSKLIL